MFDQKSTVWLDGKLMPLMEADISPLTHSLHYGSGVFEGIRAYKTEKGTHIFRLKEHIDRLFYSAEKMFIDIPYSRKELMEVCKQILRENKLEEAYLRPLVFQDDAALGVGTTNNKPRVLIAAWSWGRYLDADAVSIEVSDYRRISAQSVVSDAKVCGHYVNSILATNTAKAHGYHEALLLDHNDHIAEGPGENIFFITGNELHTPQLGSILAGITRNSVITFASDLDFSVIARDIELNEVGDFDGAFFTGTAAEVTPIASIHQNGKELRAYAIDESVRIKQYFTDIIRHTNEKYDEWREYI